MKDLITLPSTSLATHPFKISSPHSTLQPLQLEQRRYMAQRSRVQNQKNTEQTSELGRGGILNSLGM